MSSGELERGELENRQNAKIATIAICYLSKREYSRRELHSKLLAKKFTIEDINTVLDNLAEKGYQSDERFAEMFLTSRANRGSGPFKIKIELSQRGIAETVIEQLFDNSDIDWLEQARRVRQKHFGVQSPTDIKSLSKQVRYLRNKGFYQQQIDSVLSTSTVI